MKRVRPGLAGQGDRQHEGHAHQGQPGLVALVGYGPGTFSGTVTFNSLLQPPPRPPSAGTPQLALPGRATREIYRS